VPEPNDQYVRLSDEQLLRRLVGLKEARRVYRGSLREVFERQSSPHEKCLVARELVQRWLKEEVARDCVLTRPESVKTFLQVHFAGREYESFVTLFLDAQNRLIQIDELFRGTLTQTSVYPREVVKAALRHNAAAVILAHNHPSGVPEPSTQDQALTRTLTEALYLVDVKVLDHFVVGATRTVSFAERGLL